MTKEKAKDILIYHNKWRRGEPPHDEVMAKHKYTPTQIGEAIDVLTLDDN